MADQFDPNLKYFFRDKDSEANSNFNDGLAYCAAGLVESFHCSPDGKPSPSGKDLAVKYIDPWGNPNYCWRSLDEVHLSEASASNYESLKECVESLFIEEE